MGIYVSTSRQVFWTVSVLHCFSWVFGTFLVCKGVQWYADGIEGLKSTIVGEGVWQIRKREKATVIEVLRIEASGHANILSPDFLTWRSRSGQGQVS